MPGYSDPGFDTLALHAGAAPDPATGARAVPIHLTTSFVFESSDQAASLFNLERAGHVYSRISNPTNAVLEQRIAALEGGIGAIATASGQAALHLAISTLMGAGSHIVASSALYGGSHNLLHYTLRRFGIDTTFVKPGDLQAWRDAVQPNTKLFFGETVGNPGMDVLDLPAVSQIAHQAGVPLLVDATLTSPWLMKPLSHGADLVVHSATKFLSGHGTVIGGLVVDGGSFDWSGPHTQGKFAELTQAYEGFQESPATDWLRKKQEEARLRTFSRLGGGLGNQASIMSALAGDEFGRAQTDFSNYYGRLNDISGRGDNAATNIANIRTSLGTGLSNLSTAEGSSLANLAGTRAAGAQGTMQNLADLFRMEGTATANAYAGAGTEQSNLAQNLGAARAGGDIYAAQNSPALLQGLQAGLGAYGASGGQMPSFGSLFKPKEAANIEALWK